MAFDAVEVDFFGAVSSAVHHAFVDAVVGGIVAVGHGASAGGVGLRHAVGDVVAVSVAGIVGHVAVGVVSGVGLKAVGGGIDGDRECRGVTGGLLGEIAEAVIAVRLRPGPARVALAAGIRQALQRVVLVADDFAARHIGLRLDLPVVLRSGVVVLVVDVCAGGQLR